MRTKAWQCVAGAALVIGTLGAAQAATNPHPEMIDRANIGVGQSTESDQRQLEQNKSANAAYQENQEHQDDQDQTIYLLTASGLLTIGGIILVGGVVGLGGLRIPGGVAMTVGRTRHWARSTRSTGAHRAR